MKEEGRSEADFHMVDAVVPRLSLPVVKQAAPFLWEEHRAEGNGDSAGGAAAGERS